ncbi:unnamed protein product [Calypogeia fissa]
MYKHGHHDRDCCDAHQFKAGRMMRSRTLRDSLIFGTRVVRHKGLKVDDSLRIVEYKGHSRPIRDSIVYGTRQKRCRHKQCTAWHHFHEFNEELEKWDFPDQIATNQRKRELWLAARKSVLDQADIRRKSIPRDRYGELETDAGHYAGEFLRALLDPWDYGNHPHDMYRAARPSFLTDLNFEDLRAHYDPRPEAIAFHKRKLKQFKEWQRVKHLERDMKWELLRIQGIQICRHHFQHLKDRLQKAKMLWSELNHNSVWFVPWPEGDHVPELVRRSLMMISKRLSTCAPLWNPSFADLQALDHYLSNLEDLAPEVWERFHYNCKLHKHLDHHERRATRLESARRASLPALPEPPIRLPLCEPVIELQHRIAALIVALPEHLKPSPKAALPEPLPEEVEATPDGPKAQSNDKGNCSKSLVEVPASEVGVSEVKQIPPSKGHKTKEEKSRAHALKELKALDIFDELLGDGITNVGKGGKGRKGSKEGKGGKGGSKEGKNDKDKGKKDKGQKKKGGKG